MTRALIDWAALSTLVVWSIWSVVNQTPWRLARRLKRLDVIGFIPRWTFFAPEPGRTDYHLVYRDLSDDLQSGGPWIELIPVGARPWHAALWNPTRRARKAVIDLTQMMCQLSLDTSQSAAVAVSLPYLAVLNYVMHEPAGTRPFREFAIVQTSSLDAEPKLLVRSEPHRIVHS